jgi:hypothetical protein
LAAYSAASACASCGSIVSGAAACVTPRLIVTAKARPSVSGHRRVGHHAPQPLGHCVGGGVVGVGEHDQQIFAAQAHEEIAAAQLCAQPVA